jgi:fructose-1,6-bisphosphatase/inositol monophosphatase family enzyme
MAKIITQEIIEFVNQLADISAKIAKKYFHVIKPGLERIKIDDTPVTRADQEIKRAIKKEISDRFPGHEIIGEEEDINAASDYQWIINPFIN